MIKFMICYVLSGKAWDLVIEQRTAFTRKKYFGKESREFKWAHAQRTLHGLQVPDNKMFSDISVNDLNQMVEEAKRRAEIVRLDGLPRWIVELRSDLEMKPRWEDIGETMPELLRSAKLAVEKGQAPGCDETYVKQLSDFIISALVEALHKEPETEICASMLDSLNECIQTEVSTVVCGSTELKKLIDISGQLNTIKSVIYINDEVISNEVSVLKTNTSWKIISFVEVEKLGRENPVA